MKHEIRSKRKKAKLTINQASKLFEIEPSTLRKIERGFITPNEDLNSKFSKVLKFDENPKSNIQHKKSTKCPDTIGEGYVTSIQHASEVLLPENTVTFNNNRVIDLFCGAGGLSHGFDISENFDVTCGVDLMRDRIETFRQNHKFAVGIAGDIRSLSIQNLIEYSQKPNVLVGGPPCQGFSSIRPYRNLTENDKRNSLPEYYLLAVAKLKPEWVVFENVVGMLTVKKGNVFHDVIKGLKDLGYFVEYRVINSSELGVPQNRERVYVVGRANGKKFEWMKPLHFTSTRSMAGKKHPTLDYSPLFNGQLAPPITVAEAIFDLPPIESGERAESYTNEPITNYQKMIRDNEDKLTLHYSTKHSEKMLEIIKLAGKNRAALPENLTTSGFSSCYSRLSADEPSTTITVNFVHPSSNRCIHPEQNRALTPREGARLQGFKDSYKFMGNKSQICKQIGNAVPPIVSAQIANMISENS